MGLPTLVGMTGYAQHGKNTVAEVLENSYGYQPYAFADALRALLLKVDPFVDNYTRYSALLKDVGYEAAKKRPEVRRLLQEMGVGVREVLGEDAWVESLVRRLERNGVRDHGGLAVVTDVRFPNEAAAIHDLGGQVWRVTRVMPDGSAFDNGLGTDHLSERFVSDLPADEDLVASSVEELQAMVFALTTRGGTATYV